MIDLNNLKPGLNYCLIDHDDFCPAIISQVSTDCVCGSSAEIRTVGEQEFINSVNLNRSQRRAAERAAARAMRKAAMK
jgi:hypothetical protein